MLLYSLLHLSGYDLSIDDLKAFRQWHSKTPAIRNTATRRAWKPPPARWAGHHQRGGHGAGGKSPGR